MEIETKINMLLNISFVNLYRVVEINTHLCYNTFAISKTGGYMVKKTLIILMIITTMILAVSCGDDKKQVKTTPAPTESEGIDFEDLFPTSANSSTATPKIETTDQKSTPDKTNTPTENPTGKPTNSPEKQPTDTPVNQPTKSPTNQPSETKVPDFNDDNWTGLY